MGNPQDAAAFFWAAYGRPTGLKWRTVAENEHALYMDVSFTGSTFVRLQFNADEPYRQALARYATQFRRFNHKSLYRDENEHPDKTLWTTQALQDEGVFHAIADAITHDLEAHHDSQ